MHGINVMRKLSNLLSRQSLGTIYKPFTRLIMETTYDQPINDRICQKNESMQYNAARTKMVQSKEHFKQNHIKNLGWNPLNSDHGLERFVLYIKLNHLSYQSICSILFLKKPVSLCSFNRIHIHLLQN